MAYPLLIPSSLVQVVSELTGIIEFHEAAVLQAPHYWLSPRVNKNLINGRYWMPNLAGESARRFFFWNAKTIGYMVAQLEQSGILMALSKPLPQNSKKGSMEVIYHTINYELLKGGDSTSNKLLPASPSLQNTRLLQKTNANTRPSFAAEVLEKGDNN
ncbi:MAG: phage replication protein [Alphaproteobacteria bacterium]|jgi:hypothetical protein|nr:phage replication protein [Alphaproteobacteria bacterium]